MGIGITQEQRELAESVRGWAARAVPPDELRKHLEASSGDGGPGEGRPAYWAGLAELGLCGLHMPEAAGGGGGSLPDLAVVLEETGRAALPGPYLPHTLAAALLHAGTGDPGLTRALATGERVGAVALDAGTLTAVEVEGGGHVLDGAAPPVLGGAQADLLVLAAETATGTVWLAVDAATLAVRAHESADPLRPTAEVTADGVTVPGGRLLDIEALLVRDLARVLYSAEACGVAAWALETATEHAKTREQFGRPIGQFQAIKHLCADMLVRLEQARALTWDAARAAEEGAGTPAADAGAAEEGAGAPDTPGEGVGTARGLTAALAASVALEAAYTCAKDCVQILGGIGFTWEHDAHLYLRRALVARQLLGTGAAHRLRAARLAAGGARRELRMELPAEAEPYRTAAREVIAGVRGLDPGAVRRALAPTGYAAPHLPEPYGLGAGPVQQLAVQQELKDAGVTVSDLGIATWVVPSLIAYGTEAQRDRHLGPTLRGEVMWCQLFSEPEAGSDLASLRTRAERTDDGGWRVNGQKVWTSAAQWSDWGILLARTDPGAPKHQGLTFFLVDMKNTPGVEVRPLKEITGDSLFNEVYFDDVLLPADAVVGEVNDGWKVARHTLGNERVHMADQVTFSTGLQALIERLDAVDGTVQERIGALAAEAHALACIGLRTTLQRVEGLDPGAGASVRKLVQTPHQQKLAELALELLGTRGALREGPGERAVHGFLMSRCLTIAGGTTQVQLNVVAERLLGLPRDPEPRPLI
ncbi:acyl-CoA dehydrogenase [Streptomyces iconiensis]|uniref:Acyl-CoA dehydrogenase n=1 Tax=Streptomyces iconiensis TaxID=1384038 RepID=A0ABT6ZWF3_9ACTN|nr:acyl-CoA dehydrogenase [Streptomyces iconiensis]MDJ1133403.1 acyl-CoA dehydrogenase [Streptomyces iconiensis]